MSTLPIHDHFAEIEALLLKHQVLLVAGETGSGKSTQLPKLCYKLFAQKPGLIGHTQPRRIAAKTIASRIAAEMQTSLGHLVGYQMRFLDAVSDATRIKLMTDGILLAETRSDPLLKRYHTLIIDEAHERSLNIDFILGYLKEILPRRPDLKVIITSATLDHERLALHFKAPVLTVTGRSYPISIRYQPLNNKGKNEPQALYSGIVSALIHLQDEAQGDVLVFLATERDIREYRRKLAERFPRYEVLPLYARLPLSLQQKIFHAGNAPRIILSTNVAETSVTVPNVRYVIDSGLARVSRFNARLKIQCLPIEPISQANAKQRAGRAGRTMEGIVIRLYSEEDLPNRAPFLAPELLRTNLSAVILLMLKLKLKPIEEFAFIDPPTRPLIHEGYKELLALEAIKLEAIKNAYALTKLGEQMSDLPLDPRLARMVIAGEQFNVLAEILIIVSFLTLQDPREYPEEELTRAKTRHQRYQHPESEFITLLNLWKTVTAETEGFSNNAFKRYCEQNYLSHRRIREWQALQHELSAICANHHLTLKGLSAALHYQSLHQALLTGSLHFIGFYDDDKQCFHGAENKLFQIFPGSHLAKKKFKWIMSESLTETQKVYAHTVARIEANWLESISTHLVKKQYSDPAYDIKIDEVIAFETTLLYGLPIIKRRKTLFSKKDPILAREIFIREGLMPQQDQDARALLLKWENKLRRTGFDFTDEDAFEHYNKVITPEVVSFKTLPHSPPVFDISERLKMLKPFYADYPDRLRVNEQSFDLHYLFDPFSDKDGVTLTTSLEQLSFLPDTLTDWLPSGFLREKITHLLHELPKSWRKLFVPIAETVDQVLQHFKALPVHQDFYILLVKALRSMNAELTNLNELENALKEIELPSYLHLHFKVVDEARNLLFENDDLAVVKAALNDSINKIINNKQSAFDETVYQDWEFADLPDQLNHAYPALTAVAHGAQIRLYHDAQQAQAIHAQGVFTLAKTHFSKELKALKNLPTIANELSRLSFIQDKAAITSTFMDYALWRFFDEQDFDLTTIRNQHDFSALIATKMKFYTYQQSLQSWLQSLTAPLLELRVKLKSLSHKQGLALSIEDVQNQFLNLCRPDFFITTPRIYLKRNPVYFKGIERRIERIINNPASELRLFAEFAPLLEHYQNLDLNTDDELTWLFEEYRIALFAQELKTLMPMSTQRMWKLLEC